MFPFVSDDQPKKILSHKEKKELKKKKKMDVGKKKRLVIENFSNFQLNQFITVTIWIPNTRLLNSSKYWTLWLSSIQMI